MMCRSANVRHALYTLKDDRGRQYPQQGRNFRKTACAVQAFGNAAMILASGKKGNRFALPHSRIMTAPPRINRSFGSTSNIMIKANELEYNTQTYVDFLSNYTGVHQTLLCNSP